MRNDFLIVSGGTLKPVFLQECLHRFLDRRIICVDGALSLMEELQIPFDYLVGDFDSVPASCMLAFKQKVEKGLVSTVIRSYQPEKDETDTQIALLLALELNARSIVLLGATGSRIDHMLANIHLLSLPLKKGVEAYMLDETNKIYLKNQSFTIKKDTLYGPYLSLIPFERGIPEVTLKGFKYPTDKVYFSMQDSLGVSNELLLDEGQVCFLEGTFIVIEAND